MVFQVCAALYPQTRKFETAECQKRLKTKSVWKPKVFG